MHTTSLAIDVIRQDGGTQPRAAIHEAWVSEYAEDMQAGATFPAIDVFFDGNDYWLADVFHRTAAALAASRTEIEAKIHQGTRRDAILFSVGANGQHGHHRTNEDKRRAVDVLLNDSEWSRWSDGAIAKQCEVSDRFVANRRDFLSPNGSEIGHPRLVTRGGTTFEMQTDGIGQRAVVGFGDPQIDTVQRADPVVALTAYDDADVLERAKEIRLELAEQRRAENEALRQANPLPAVEGKYGTIVIDPPWDMQKIEREVRPNQVEFDYPTMSEDELAAFPVADMAVDDCHLFCWTTQKYLPVAFRLLEAWGFRYVFTMVWHKPGGFQPIGLAQYNGEFVLYGRRGSPVFAETKAFPCVFCAERREHSRKPNEFYDMVRRVTHDGRIDVFSRESREGFDQFGNETEKFGDAVGLGAAARR